MAEVVSQDGYKHYKFGISENNIRNASKEEVEVAFTQMFNEIAEEHNIKLKISTYETSKQLDSAIKNNEVQGFFGNTLDLLNNIMYLNQDHIFTVKLNENLKEQYLLLVRKDSHFNSLSDLKSKKLAYSLGDEVGFAYLNKLIQEKKMGSSTKFFSQIIKKKYSAVTTNAVFFKETEAALVLQTDFEIASELNPQLKQQLIAIETSPEFIVNIIALRKDLNQEDYLVFDHIVSEATKYKKGQKLFGMFKAKSLNKIDLNSLENIKTLVNQSMPARTN